MITEHILSARLAMILLRINAENRLGGTILKKLLIKSESLRMLTTAGNRTPKNPIISVAKVNIPVNASVKCSDLIIENIIFFFLQQS